MLPFDSWFCMFFLQILEFVAYQLPMFALDTHPADQLDLFEVYYTPPINFSIQCSAPLFVGFQVNQQYFFIVSVRYHNLLRTDHLNRNIIQIFTFHFLPE